MGHWGSKPFENDDAADWLFDIRKISLKTLERAVKELDRDIKKYGSAVMSGETENGRAAIEVMLRVHETFVPEDYEPAAIFLEALLRSDAYFDGWKDPARLRRDLTEQLREVMDRETPKTPKRRRR